MAGGLADSRVEIEKSRRLGEWAFGADSCNGSDEDVSVGPAR